MDGLKDGRVEGREEGKREERSIVYREIVLRMHQRGKPLKEIADDTGLAKEDVQHIIQEAEEEAW